MRDEALVTVVIGVRVCDACGERRRNLDTCLGSLRLQTLARQKFRVVLVEQDAEPRIDAAAMVDLDQYLFAYNPGSYNRGWGLNVGAASVLDGVLCLLDADLLVPTGFLERGLSTWRSGTLAFRPFTEILYLDERSTDAVTERLITERILDVDDARHTGHVFRQSQGGCLWVDTRLYHRIGGHDERFEGWGREDREFWNRLSAVTPVVSLDGRLLHLSHSRAAEHDPAADHNRQLYAALANGNVPAQAGPIGAVDRYRREIP